MIDFETKLPPLPDSVAPTHKIALSHLVSATQHISKAIQQIQTDSVDSKSSSVPIPSPTTAAGSSSPSTSAGTKELIQLSKLFEDTIIYLRSLIALSSSNVTTTSPNNQITPTNQSQQSPTTSPTLSFLPPPSVRSEPDRFAQSCALKQARSLALRGENALKSMRDLPLIQQSSNTTSRSCVPVIVDELTADPIPHDLSLQPQNQAQNNQNQQSQTQQSSQQSEEEDEETESSTTSSTTSRKKMTTSTANEEISLGKGSQKMNSKGNTTTSRHTGSKNEQRSPRSSRQQHNSTTSPVLTHLQAPPRGLEVVMKEVKPIGKVSSLLTKELARCAQPPESRKTKYTISLPPDYSQSVTIEMPEAATVLETVNEALRRYGQEKREAVVILKDDPRAYLLYTADFQGMPETDFPAAEESRRITDMQCVEFALVDNPDYEVPVIMKIWIKGIVENSSSNSTQNNASASSSSSFVVLPYRADITSKEILREVCRKSRVGAPADFELQLMTLDVPFAPDVTIGELGVTELRLVRKKTSSRENESGNADLEGHLPRNLTKIFGPTFFFTAETARELKQYPVVRVSKKFGFRHVLTMTIDGERVAVSAPETGEDESAGVAFIPIRKFTILGGSSKSKKMKQPIRMADISKVGNVSGRPNAFFIKVGMHTHEFESSRRSEIVAQLTCLLQNLGKM